jgi:DNA-binding IclR family transcriptional regulator
MHTQTSESCTTTVFTPFRQMELLRRVRGEFKEMPGLRLSLEQAMRLWSLDRATCVEVLSQLQAARFLELDPHGRYRLAHSAWSPVGGGKVACHASAMR